MSNNSTSSDISLHYNVTQAQIDNFNLSTHLIDLLWNEPFYSRILRSLTNIETDEIPTAGVLCKDNDIKMWWNKKFFASLTNQQIRGVLKHECLHLVFSHTTDRKRDPHKVWNYATDLAINCLINVNELPDFCLRPGKPLPVLKSEDLAKMNANAIAAYYKLSKQIETFPLNKTSEYYFEKLLEDNNIEELENELGDGNEMLIQFDDHEGWDKLSNEERDYFKHKIKEIVKSAANEASKNGWGSISSELRKELSNIFSNVLDWKSLLQRFCSYSTSNERQSSIKRLNRKYPNIHAGIKKDYTPTIAVYIDESGSVNNEDLEKIYSELNSLSKRTNFYLYKFDTAVNEESSFLWKKGKRFNAQRNLTGGTCFNAPTKHALSNKNKFDGYVIITDGYAAKPNISLGLKRCYIITPGGSLQFEKDTKDILITMK